MSRPYSRYYNFNTDIERQEYYRKKIAYLQSLYAKKQQGIPLADEELAYAITPLQQAGILDENGELASHYRGDA